MNYLTMCPLIAALIGGIIGWLLKGDCQKEILINNDWNEKLKKNDNQWENKIKKIKKDYDRNISILNQKVLFSQNILKQQKNQQEVENTNWLKAQNSWKTKRERLIDNNDSNLVLLNKELTFMRKKIKNIKLEGIKLLNTNIEYTYQIKKLTKQQSIYIFNLKKVKDEIKTLKLKK